MTRENKINFSVAQKIDKKEIILQLAKVSGEKNVFTTSKTKHFEILTTKKEKKLIKTHQCLMK